MRDPIRDEVVSGGGDWEAFKRLPIEPWQQWFGTILLGALALIVGVPGTYRLLIAEVYGVAVYAAVGIAMACLALGGAMCWARDYRQSRITMFLQVAIAIAAGVIAFFGISDPWERGVAFLAAVVTVANGLDKLRKTL